ncbi:MAG: prolipoprotein diacylglyceryl transferase [Candidatus Omnitrophota bacterium]
MYPVICRIGPLTVFSYGLMLALAVVVCGWFLAREARAHQIRPDEIYDLIFWTVIAGIIGARLFFIVLNLSFFLRNPLEIFMVHHGGLAVQGGLLLGGAAAIIFIRRKGWSFCFMADLIAPYLALGHAIGRIGCFLNGCCYGRQVGWGVYFPVHDAHLHPTQLYASAALLVIFFVLRFSRRSALRPGSVFALYMILYAVQRFFIEFFRADHDQWTAGLSVFQWISLVIFIVGSGLLFYLNKRGARGDLSSHSRG